MQLWWCENGVHYYERPPEGGRRPRSCPLHRERSGILAWCEEGGHHYERPVRRGRVPRSCPEHASSAFPGGRLGDKQTVSARRPSRTQWVGDLKTCFLLDLGWTFRIRVNYFLIENKGGWRLPLSFAEQLAIQNGEERTLNPIDPILGQPLHLQRLGSALSGGPIATALEVLEAEEGDLLFVGVRDGRYGLVLRSTEEVPVADPLGRLLWSCGLPPRDPEVRRSAWRRLGLALGGTGNGIADVRRRLEKRRDPESLELVDEIERGALITADGDPWPSGWEYTAPLIDSTTLFALAGDDGSARVALGVTDATRQPPRDTIPTPGGLCWLDQPSGFDEAAVRRRLRDAGRGLIPAAQRAAWSDWLRAEHAARRAALAGNAWSIRCTSSDMWSSDMGGALGPREALQAVGLADTRAPGAPVVRVNGQYPRSAAAFAVVLDTAHRRGVRELHGDPQRGFRTIYEGGRERAGCALHDVFA